jgi:hypothetical protein
VQNLRLKAADDLRKMRRVEQAGEKIAGLSGIQLPGQASSSAAKVAWICDS